jgi:hypothetical protein
VGSIVIVTDAGNPIGPLKEIGRRVLFFLAAGGKEIE